MLLWFLFTGGVATAATTLNLEDGMWEVTSQVKMQGMMIPPMTFSQCITKENAVPQGNSPGQDNCKVSDMKTVGNTVLLDHNLQRTGRRDEKARGRLPTRVTVSRAG